MEDKFSISITCECVPAHDWMAFSSWYSFKKFLPDCIVSLETKLTLPMFGWANRAGVRIVRQSKADVKFSPFIMSIRDFNGDMSICSSKSQDQHCFVDYSGGCGDFVVEQWINRKEVPFYKALRRFGSYQNLTVNEVAILEFWEKCHQIYRVMGGS